MPVYNAILTTYFHDAVASTAKNGTDAIASFVDESMQPLLIAGLRKYSKYPLQNIKANRRLIAQSLLAAGEYHL